MAADVANVALRGPSLTNSPRREENRIAASLGPRARRGILSGSEVISEGPCDAVCMRFSERHPRDT